MVLDRFFPVLTRSILILVSSLTRWTVWFSPVFKTVVCSSMHIDIGNKSADFTLQYIKSGKNQKHTWTALVFFFSLGHETVSPHEQVQQSYIKGPTNIYRWTKITLIIVYFIKLFFFGLNEQLQEWGWFFYKLYQLIRFNNTHIKLTRCTTMFYLIKETYQVRVGISANNETKEKLAKLYFEVQIN